ncbi:MAG: tetratricopeptide repeat protein [Thermoplasmata archaeon]
MGREHYWRRKARTLLERGEFSAALEAFETALSINSTNPESISGKGISLLNLGQIEESVKWFDRAIALEPMYHEAWYYKASALEQMGRLEDANRCYARAFLIQEGVPPHKHSERAKRKRVSLHSKKR